MKLLIFLFCIHYPLVALSMEQLPGNNNTFKVIRSFDFKEVLDDKEKFEEFVHNAIGIVDLKDKDKFEMMLDNSTRGLIIHDFVVKNPLIKEFAFRFINSPSAIAGILYIFIKKNELIIFSLLIVFSLIVSHYLGEFKFKFRPLSLPRLFYSFFRFASVNVFRIYIFLYFFEENIAPTVQIYMSSLNKVQNMYPILHKTSLIISDLSSYWI